MNRKETIDLIMSLLEDVKGRLYRLIVDHNEFGFKATAYYKNILGDVSTVDLNGTTRDGLLDLNIYHADVKRNDPDPEDEKPIFETEGSWEDKPTIENYGKLLEEVNK